MLFSRPLVIVLLALGVGISWGATSQVVVDSTMLLDECVVTSTMSPRMLKSVPVMTQVLTHQDIVRFSPRTASDLLQMAIPGIEIDVHGTQTRLKMQGMAAEHVLLMIDGEPINSEGNGSVDLSKIDVANIDRIEILRGAASALYGSSAMGGVINFITKQVYTPLSANVSTDYSSEGLWRIHASMGFKVGAFSSLSTGSYSIQTPYELLGGTDDPFRVRGSNIWVLGEKLSYRSPKGHWQFVSTLSASRRTLNWDEKIKYLYDSYDAGGRISYVPTARHSSFVSYNASGYERTQDFFTAPRDRYIQIFDLKTHRIRGQYNFGQDTSDAVLINTGIDAVWESVQGERIVNKGQRFHSHAVAWYGQAEWRICSYLSTSLDFRYDIHSGYGHHFSPKATLLFKQKQWRLRPGYSEGFRSPSTKELYMDWEHRGIFRLMLNPETSKMLSISPELQITKDINLTLVASYNQIYNRIYNQEEEGGLVRRFRNTSEVSEVWQTQLGLRWQIAPTLRLNADYAYVWDKINVKSKKQEILPASTVRPHNLTASMSYSKQLGRWQWYTNASFRWVSSISTAVFSEAIADYQLRSYEGYTILRLGTSFSYRGFKATIGIDNLLNHKPEQINVSSSFSPGLTYFTSLSLSL